MSKTLIIPGSFNPVTNNHISMALTAKNAVGANKVLFVPAHDSYVARKRALIPVYCRVALINSMEDCEKYNIWASDIETANPFPQITYSTVTQIREEDDKNGIFNEYYVCLGMDNIRYLTTWYGWKPLVEEYNIIACTREGQRLDTTLVEAGLMDYKDHFTEIQIPQNPYSSSFVRGLCEKGDFRDVKDLVPSNVYDYLLKFYGVMNHLYYTKSSAKEVV